MIINDDRVLTHYGVKGMRWGVRKEREAATRSKAKKIVRNYKNSSKMSWRDLQDADWMSRNINSKLSQSLTRAMVPQILKICMNQKIPTSPEELRKVLASVARNAAINFGKNELSGRGAMKRYTDEGKKDESKKQYSRRGITPNRLIASLAAVGVSAAPFLAAVGKEKLKAVAADVAKDRERVEKWGSNLLPEPGKTSTMHTIYDDGYMSILEKIEP